MKIMHLGDLHLGKIVLEQSMIKDQEYILEQILEIINNKNIDVIMICGDIYDRAIPPIEAVTLFDEFLTKLERAKKYVLVISGNHDSKDRLKFGNRILENRNIYIESEFKGSLKKVTIDNINFYMLPFIKPSIIKEYFEDVVSYNDAVKKVIENTVINKNEKNIIMVHQFITGSIKSDSETISLGGLDNIDVTLFKDFDYVALGHIHRPQKLTRETIRYSGSILKYSFSESLYNKSVPIIDDLFNVTLEPLTPLRDLRDITGNISDLLKDTSDDYIRAIITDEEEIYDPIGRLRKKYPNILKLEIKNKRSSLNENNSYMASGNIKERTPIDLFNEFYLNQQNITLSNELREILEDTVKEVIKWNPLV